MPLSTKTVIIKGYIVAKYDVSKRLPSSPKRYRNNLDIDVYVPSFLLRVREVCYIYSKPSYNWPKFQNSDRCAKGRHAFTLEICWKILQFCFRLACVCMYFILSRRSISHHAIVYQLHVGNSHPNSKGRTVFIRNKLSFIVSLLFRSPFV